ncbi:MAG: hypothetical protein D6797_05575 [Bdellovibrio sp.]|nr:MAG: hypothetical protein D6797_05575 [Bdellovibrio sp.]
MFLYLSPIMKNISRQVQQVVAQRQLPNQEPLEAVMALKLPSPFAPLKGNQGIALLIALFATMLLTSIAIEVTFDTKVESISAAQSIRRLRAYYAAKSGVELSLLRIQIYKQALKAYGNQLKGNESLLDPIWQFPFAWPPVLPKDLTRVSKDLIESTVKESSLDTQFMATIESEGGKIDINDLGSSSKALKEAVKQQILQIFSMEKERNEEFREKYGSFNFEELVNNMIDWVDEDDQTINGASESSLYSDELANPFIPPNESFKTLDEIRMVKGMNDDFFNLLKNKVTVFGTKGINVNYASEEVLKSIDPQITDELAKKIIQRRNNPNLGGPFENEEDFLGYLGLDQENFNPSGIPLLFDAEYNFRITSTGADKNVTRTIEAIVYDFDAAQKRLNELLDKEEEKTNTNNSNTTETTPNNTNSTDNTNDTEKTQEQTESTPKGRPRVVYWKEN